MPDVFSYTDFRALLKDSYETRKAENPHFSYRYMGQKVGFKSAGFFTNIIQGKRNISPPMIFKFAALFKFNKKETEYFEALVLYDQAKSHAEKKHYFEKILSLGRSEIRLLNADQYEYFDKWYYVAIREMLGFVPFTGNYHEISSKLVPYIAPSEAKKAIDLLLRLGLIEEHPDGSLSVTDKTVTTVPHVPLVAIHNFQLETMRLAGEAIDRIPQEERSISTLTINTSVKTFRDINEKLAAFRREILELVKAETEDATRVYQFNFQIFPMSVEYKGPDSG